jgi:hypothetical protein
MSLSEAGKDNGEAGLAFDVTKDGEDEGQGV